MSGWLEARFTSCRIRFQRTLRKQPLSTIECLPYELIETVCLQLCNRMLSDQELLDNVQAYSANLPTLAQLSLASRRLHRLLTPMLYHFACRPRSQRLIPGSVPWEVRLRNSIDMPGAPLRFQYTRILDAGLALALVLSYTEAMPNLRAMRTSSMFWASGGLLRRIRRPRAQLEGLLLTVPAALSFQSDIEPLTLQWAIFEKSTYEIMEKPASGPHKIREVVFRDNRLSDSRLIMETLDTSYLRKLEIGPMDQSDFEGFWRGMLLPNLDSLTLVLYRVIVDCCCLSGRVGACELKLIRTEHGENWRDTVYRTLPSNIRSLCPDFHAIMRKDVYLEAALREMYAGLEEVAIPSPIFYPGFSEARYLQGVVWIQAICQQRKRAVRVTGWQSPF